MKNKAVKVGIVLGAGVVIASLSYYFLIYKPSKAGKQPQTPPEPAVATVAKTVKKTNNTNNTPTPAPVAQSMVGKAAYAVDDGTKILYLADATTYGTRNEDAFCGIIAGTKKLGGADYYTLGDGGLVVPVDDVYEI